MLRCYNRSAMEGFFHLGSFEIFWLDIVIFALFVLYAIQGYKEGFVASLLSLGSFLLSFFLAIQWYLPVGNFLSETFSLSGGIAKVAGFFLVAFLSEIIISTFLFLFARQAHGVVKHKTPRFVYRIDAVLGVIPSVLSLCILLAFIFSLILALPFAPFLKQSVLSSRIATFLVSQTQGFEKTTRNVFGGAVHDTLNFLTIEPKSHESVQLRFSTTKVTIDEKAERQMLDLVNKERAKAGVGPVAMDEKLRQLARDYSKDMFARGYFSHYNPEGQSPFDRMDERGITYVHAGENLALAPNVELAMQGLMESPGHRANILSENFGKIGIGVMDGGIYGQMFTQEFTN